MFETLGLPITAPQAAIGLGFGLGLLFGAMAEISRFCLRRAVAGAPGERRSAAGVWAMALVVAMLGTQGAVALGWIDFSGHRWMAPEVPVLALGAGGTLFGAGMVLTRGCISRLAVLGGSGNLRALTVLGIFAVVAHATLKGVLSPLRVSLGAVAPRFDPALPLAAGFVLAGLALVVVARSSARPRDLVLAGLIGLLVPAGWVGTGWVLHDAFDPVALQSLSFTAPAAETLFWTIASTSIPATFGVGLLCGVLVGAAASALAGRRFAWASFETPGQTLRYAGGAALMGFGGVLAGGCTLGAGLSGMPTLSVAALIAFAGILLGSWLTARAVTPR